MPLTPVHFTAKGPAGPLRRFRRPAMTKPSKGNGNGNKLSSALFVLGYDDQQKPRGARFVDANANLVVHAGELMDLNVYEATNGELADLTKKLPVGRLYSTGKGFVPNIRPALYSEIIA